MQYYILAFVLNHSILCIGGWWKSLITRVLLLFCLAAAQFFNSKNKDHFPRILLADVVYGKTPMAKKKN